METSLGGAEAGRCGRWLGAGSDMDDDPRLREGGESRAVFIIGVAGGVSWGVVGVAGWRTIVSLGETSRGVSWFSLERSLVELVTSCLDMVREQDMQDGDYWELDDDDGRPWLL